MESINISQAANNALSVGEVSFPLFSELPARFNLNPLKRSNRVNIRLHEEDISGLEAMALETSMPFQAFLAEVIHQYAKSKMQEK